MLKRYLDLLPYSKVEFHTINVDFPQGAPTAIDFAYNYSQGDCSSLHSFDCNVSSHIFQDIQAQNLPRFLTQVNNIFSNITPVPDVIHVPSNFVEIKVPGKSGICHIDFLNKTAINVHLNKDRSCGQ